MRFGGERKLFHHVAAGQVVAATAVNDHATRTLFNDTLCLEQGVALLSPFVRSTLAAQLGSHSGRLLLH